MPSAFSCATLALSASSACTYAARLSATSAPTPYPAPQYYQVDINKEFGEVDQDHFDGTNANSWQQAFYVNDTYWKGAASNAPVFLCMGGEGPALDGSAVVASVHCNDAVEMLPETGALMFALEHRYYGCHNMSACPVTSFAGKESLRFLSSRQALGDAAAFHAFASQKWGLSAANKWVTWGGSYPGMLAGWARLKFPHLFHASVSSSAPVLAQVDMRGYNDVVAYAFTVSDNSVGGSPSCSEAIRVGHAIIGNLMNTTAGRTELASLFPFSVKNADWLQSREHQREFAGEGVAQFPAQSNDPSCTTPCCSIGSICKVMLNASIGDEVHRLAHVAQQQNPSKGFAQATRYNELKVDRNKRDPTEIPDFWGYQTCTEFAFYQTCEIGSQCFFTQGLDELEDEDSFCHSLYGVSTAKINSNVNYSNVYFGANYPSGSRVLYPSGEVDPWRSLSIVNSTSTDLPTLWVPGASHHFWTHPSSPTDQPSVVAARAVIKKQVTAWLSVD